MKKIITLILSLSLIFSLSINLNSCDRDYDEKEVSVAAVSLIEKSMFLNDIYWGKGIPYIQNSSNQYCEADWSALYYLGFETIDELKKITEEVFSKKYCSNIYSSAFPIDKDDPNFRFSRYYQKYEDEFQTIPVCIMVYTKFENMLPDKVEYLYDTLTVTHSEGDVVYVKVQAKVTRDDGNSQIVENVIGLIEEENGWKINTPTYLKYNDRRDEYEDLLEKNK